LGNLHKNIDQLKVIQGLKSIEYFYYYGDENLETEFEYDAISKILIVRSKDDYLNLCDKFGKMIQFVNKFLMLHTAKGIFFTDDDITIKPEHFLHNLKENATINYWGKKVGFYDDKTFHIKEKCNKNEHLKAIIDNIYPLINTIPFEIPYGIEYCPGGGFYLTKLAISLLLQKSDLFLSFPSMDNLHLYQEKNVFKNVCVIDDINVAVALKAFYIYPIEKDMKQIVYWEGLT
jgi:hypothetical protein